MKKMMWPHTMKLEAGFHSLYKLAHLHLGAGMALQEFPLRMLALLKACLTLRLGVHWLASSLTCSVSIPGFDGAGPEQAIHGLGLDAYKAKWIGCGLVHPPSGVDHS